MRRLWTVIIAVAVTDIKPGSIAVMPASRKVSTNQEHVHPRLADVVLRHLQTHFRKPVAEHNLLAFRQLREQLSEQPRPLVLDSFCGTGHSTATLAARHPDHLVVGIDKSGARLARHPGMTQDNYLLLQADCEPIWGLLRSAGIAVEYHYLLYPNPWPRSTHLKRRIHGHPGFSDLLHLGGELELRSNWQTYVEEFGMAVHLAGYRGYTARLPDPGDAGDDLTLFERKYRLSGHALWLFRARLKNTAAINPAQGPP
jgi:tRNA G46 methylase TrmB